MTEANAATNAAGTTVPDTQVTESAPVVANTDVTPPAPNDGLSSRIDELTRYRRDAERQAESNARRAEAAERDREYWREQALKSQQQPKQNDSTASKTLADFEYDEAKYREYLQDELKQTAAQAARQAFKEEQEKLKKDQEEREKAARKQSYAKRAQEFAKANKDFHDRVSDPSLPISNAMADVIEESEEGPALAYYLANNIPIAESIFGLSPLAAARALGRIEGKLIAEREKPVRTVSAAPPPPPKIEAAGDPQVEKDPSEMTTAEYRKWRRRQIAQR